jgi:hypothetical protein
MTDLEISIVSGYTYYRLLLLLLFISGYTYRGRVVSAVAGEHGRGDDSTVRSTSTDQKVIAPPARQDVITVAVAARQRVVSGPALQVVGAIAACIYKRNSSINVIHLIIIIMNYVR